MFLRIPSRFNCTLIELFTEAFESFMVFHPWKKSLQDFNPSFHTDPLKIWIWPRLSFVRRKLLSSLIFRISLSRTTSWSFQNSQTIVISTVCGSFAAYLALNLVNWHGEGMGVSKDISAYFAYSVIVALFIHSKLLTKTTTWEVMGFILQLIVDFKNLLTRMFYKTLVPTMFVTPVASWFLSFCNLFRY